MDGLLWLRVSAAFLVDISLAALCGLLLAERWFARIVDEAPQSLARTQEMPVGRRVLRVLAGVLCFGSCCQLLLLAITFSGESGVRTVLAMLPDVCRTHAGSVLLTTSVVAGVLLAAAWLVRGPVRSGVCGLLTLSLLGLHGAVGHASVDGVLSWAEGLQWAHLLGMALWSGGVVVSGLLVVPRMADAEKVRVYMERLSALSTWCVALVLLSGVVKGYRVTGGVALLRSSFWGQTLLLKGVAVTFTVCLGVRNRWLLGSSANWDETSIRNVRQTLRAESICMIGVLLLSAWLANSPLPMEMN